MNALIKKISLSLFATLVSTTMMADIPAGYYNSLNGKKDADLKTAAYNIIHDFTLVSSYSDLPKYFAQTDVYPDGSNRWWDMYSNDVHYAPSFSGLNREHSFPKSWWGGLTNVNAYTDLNHLYPSEANANMAKSNYPLGEVSSSYDPIYENGVTTVGYPVSGQGGGAQLVFEPADEYKGDFARTYFYMATCYQDYTWKYTYMVASNTYPTLNTWSVNLLLKWSREDPVSDKETARNEAVYKIQNNRNPFIDFPELAEYIWGNKKGQVFNTSDQSEPTGTPTLITPVQDMSLDFGEVALGQSSTARLLFKGEYLTAPIELLVYTGNKDYFSIPTKSIAANLVNTTDGYALTVTYKPTEVGSHSSRLLISGGGLSGSRGIALSGACLEVPTLTAPTALAADNIEADSYCANWSTPSGQDVDYYIVTRTKYVNGSVTEEEIEADESGIQIDGFADSDRESYSVQSVRLGYRSPASNVVFVEHSGVTGVTSDLPMVIAQIPGGFRFVSNVTHNSVRIFDMSGRLVQYIPQVNGSTEVLLPAGVYMIVSDESKRPVKATVF